MKRRAEQDNDIQAVTLLNMLAAKVKGVGYLIESCASEEPQPLNMDEVYWGIGMILSDIGREIRGVAKHLDEKELERPKRRTRKRTT